MTDDRPLHLGDIGEGDAPLMLLADRVTAHLGTPWQARSTRGGGAILEGPDGMRLHFGHRGPLPYNRREFHVTTYTLTGRPTEAEQLTMSVFTLPSHIAARLTTDTIPKMRKRLEAARKQQTVLAEDNSARKALITSIAARLQWNASSYQCHSREPYASLDPRYRQRAPRGSTPVVTGRIGYRQSGRHSGLELHLAGLDETLTTQIVDLIVADQQAKAAAASEQEQDGSAEGNSNETEETQTA